MRDVWAPETVEEYTKYLADLRLKREARKKTYKLIAKGRNGLSRAQRDTILNKTDGKCHICGGEIQGTWEADHVLAHSVGGKHSVDNYLPAHKICNNYRWDYLPDEFQEILRLGVWLRTQIQNKKKLGILTAESFIKYEQNRIMRRKQKN